VQRDTATEPYDAFGVFGTALQDKIGLFHSKLLSKHGAENSKCIAGAGAWEPAVVRQLRAAMRAGRTLYGASIHEVLATGLARRARLSPVF
jgi:hypothetical protein